MMVTVASFSFPHEAHIARASLDAEGIPAVVADEHTISMQWLYSDALGGVKVQVPEPFAEKAKAVLSEDNSQALASSQEVDELDCPVCGSKDVEIIEKGKGPAFLVFIMLHFPIWPFKRKLSCNNCKEIGEYKT